MADKPKTPGKVTRSLSWMFKPFINAKGWLGYESVKQGFHNIQMTYTDLFRTPQQNRQETFIEAVERLNLDKASLHKQYQNFRFMVLISITITMLLFTLSIYWLAHKGYFGGTLTFLLSLIGLANAIRYHFWMYQIKQEKLGCTIQEWFQATFFGKRGP